MLDGKQYLSSLLNYFYSTPDPEMVHHLTSIGTEAAHVVLRECDPYGCAMVEGHAEADGTWRFTEGLPSQQHEAPTKVEMLMFEQDDCE
jgi:hypothetical protein